jgi:hypothetical protein
MPSIDDIIAMAEQIGRGATRDRGATAGEVEASLNKEVEEIHRLWVSDDADAQTALGAVKFCEDFIRGIVIKQTVPLTRPLFEAMEKLLPAIMELMDDLRELGSVRARALGLPIPGTAEWDAESAAINKRKKDEVNEAARDSLKRFDRARESERTAVPGDMSTPVEP